MRNRVVPEVVVLLITMLLAASCKDNSTHVLATHKEETTLAQIGKEIARVVSRDNGWTLEAYAGPELDGEVSVEMLVDRRVDFALTVSDFPGEATIDVRTVLPLYPEIIAFIYSGSMSTPKSLGELIEGRRVGVGPEGKGHSQKAIEIIADFGIPVKTYTPIYTPLQEMTVSGGQMDVLLTFIGADRQRIEKQIAAGAKIFSIDDYKLAGQGSKVDGFLLKHPYFNSFVIPKNTFGKYPDEPILTLSLTTILVSRRDVSEKLVYELVSSLFGSAHFLTEKNTLFGFLNQDFDTSKQSFPLHEGTLQYLNRDQPSFLERYAEVMALLFSVSILGFGLAGSVRRMLQRRRKDRIDVYYQAVQEVRPDSTNQESLMAAITELNDLRQKAITQLQQEKLTADHSFTIFLDILASRLREIEANLEHLNAGPKSD